MLTGTFCSAAALLVRVGMTLELEVFGPRQREDEISGCRELFRAR